MKIVHKKLSEVKLAPYNPRKIGVNEKQRLKRSLMEFGYVDPIIYNVRNRFVIGGNQRITVLRELAREDPEKWDVKYEMVEEDLDEDMEKALNIALNKISGEWDIPKLKDLLVELDTGAFDIEITGFDLEEIGRYIDYNPEVSEDSFDIDTEQEKIKEPQTERGDVYILGDHRLMCGDALEQDDVDTLLDGEKANMVFTDPPYNVSYVNTKNKKYTSHQSGHHKAIINDEMSDEDWKKFNINLANIMISSCTGDLYVWGAPGPDGMRQRIAFIDSGLHWSATVVWKKNAFVMSRGNYQRMYEPCFYGWRIKSSFVAGRDKTEVWEVNRPTKSDLHPTMKPIELCGIGIANSSKIGDKVLDLFGGSGSTMIACEQLKRSCYMMEISELYCDVIVKRWEEFTGKTALKR